MSVLQAWNIAMDHAYMTIKDITNCVQNITQIAMFALESLQLHLDLLKIRHL
jgi:hypothetical protein